MPTDDLVGINLDTMNDMKEQFIEKEKKFLKIFRKLAEQSACLNHQISDIIETLEIQTCILKKLFTRLDNYSDYDDEIKEIVDLFEGSSRIGLLSYESRDKWLLYKTSSDILDRLNEEKTVLEMNLDD